ncbi:MAG: cytidine deaminase [Lachnospiraceae bacterium]|nr:cytidine deaminase [Lachnospiraceae bacterium]
MQHTIKADELINGAKAAMKAAYAPYSHFYVGAAVLAEDGKIYTGCNIENSSYGATNCAERTAIFKAVSEGCRKIHAIAICGGYEGVIEAVASPCGICRQVMSEFGQNDMPVFLIHKDGFDEYTLGELLPCSFTLEN